MSENNAPQFSFRFRGSSFDDMVETLGGAFGAFDAAPVGRAESFRWGLDFSASNSAVMLTGYHEAEFQFNIEPTVDTAEYLSLVVPRSGGMAVTYGDRIAEAGQGKLLLYNNFEPDSVIMHGQSNVIDELLINWSVILQTVGQTFEIPFSGSLDLLPELDLSTPIGQTIGNLTETIMSGMRDDGPLLQSPLAMAHMTQALADLVVRLLPHRLSHFLEKGPALIAPRHVRKAIEFMHANIDQPITMAKVAEAAGVSSRALETGFRAFRGTSPAVYLLTLRLRAARQDLLDPENRETMKAICLKWGFFHFGRFSAVYKTTYGENPSDTRKRMGRP
ncbi:AraC family transcriptional regulator (plasmid) [Rhizobium sp. Pop5]|uniref:AraC family transcriptional regulator n=1 Tax=Rhizobium sp. Pop5 TaxID=1223565 RepID=UPI000283568D|nr:AraC family transcriptional regulator [Rhizobium sp. Pop5]EJZ18963.1 AraC family transcriptional regulator [Rhizobium sp. Pop5]UVD60742.1 AraC family transcriptional regulator [Rhizobium sp. Pop5]